MICVPACFNTMQRKAIRDAAAAVPGLHAMRFIPPASLAAFALDLNASQRRVLVFDLGGGHVEASVMVLEEGIVEVKAVRGNAQIGGEDFTWRMMEHFLQVRCITSVSPST